MEVRPRSVERLGAPAEMGSAPVAAPPTTVLSNAPSIEFYRQLVDGMTCGVLTVNREGIITTLNDHARTILGLERSDMGRPCEEALCHCPRLAHYLRESFTMSSPPSRAEMEIPSPSRRARTIGFSISMIASLPGEIEGAALFFKDLTKVEEQEERDRLRDRLAALGTMAAQMAHEIRNPLTSIQVSAALVQRRLASKGEPTDLLQKIDAEITRIEATIASCLEYARPLTPDLRPTDLKAMLEEAVSLAHLRAGSDSITLQKSYGRGLGRVLCDRSLIRQGLVNILVNACEAMEGHGTITITADATPGRSFGDQGEDGPARESAGATLDDLPMLERLLTVRIADSGPGIPAELLGRIFYPFFTTKTSGSGIGLAMSRKVIESHGGWIDVESEPGRGTTFIIKLPLQAAASGGASS